MNQYRNLAGTELGIAVRSPDGRSGVLSVWHVNTQGERGEIKQAILPLAVDDEGQRYPAWERQVDQLFQLPPASDRRPRLDGFLKEFVEPMVQRELLHRGIVNHDRGYHAKLIAWVEIR